MMTGFLGHFLQFLLTFRPLVAADAGAGGCHVGDGGAAAAREAPAGQAATEGHVLPAATSDAGESCVSKLQNFRLIMRLLGLPS